MAKLAPCLVTLRSQINEKWPNRSKVSDGWIGDAAHAKSKSDHNPGPDGVVEALDITHDPVHGLDASKLAEEVRHDPRCEYVISNGRIAFGTKPWKKYTGVNPHNKHCHISCMPDAKRYNQAQPWAIAGVIKTPKEVPVVTPVVTKPPVLRKGSKGAAVRELQALLKTAIDGDFGKKTVAAVMAFQKSNKLKADGVVGQTTWAALEKDRTPTLDPVMTAPLGLLSAAPVVYDPMTAVKFYQEHGWDAMKACVLVANLCWESGGNGRKPMTILFNAHGDKDKGGVYRSHGAGQWNEMPNVMRFQDLCKFAEKRGTLWSDPETQLLFLVHELKTSEKKAGAALKAATTIEAAMKAAILIWRPSIPHADRRLAIAKRLFDAIK
jgi:hypothetical protein